MKAIEITTMVGCPLMCTYCPQDALKENYGKEMKYMSLETFKQIIDNTPSEYRIDFSGYAEPWVNPDCVAMFKYAMKKGHSVAIFTTLYNWNCDTVAEMSELVSIYRSKIVLFKIHLPDTSNNMLGWRLTPEWEYAFLKMKEVVNAVGIRYEAMTMSDFGVHSSIKHLAGIELTHNWSCAAHDRAGTLEHEAIKGQIVKLTPRHAVPIRCVRLENHNHVVLPTGDVVLCCMDYGMKHVLGNLKTHTIEQIREGKPFQELLQENAKNEFNNSLCRTCTEAIRI
jgi:radical SAM protein with 4Fe4S-binding SPASM domain